MAMGYFGFLVLLAAPLALLWLPLALWRLIGNVRGKPARPCCARCRYPTTEHASVRCPECGADLLREGVLTPAMRVRSAGGVLLVVGAWTIILGVATSTLMSWAAFAMPVRMEARVNVSGAPASGQYTKYTLRGTAETVNGLQDTARALPLDLTLTVVALDGALHTTRFVREEEDVPIRLDDGRVVDELSAFTLHDAVKGALVRAGADPDAAETDMEAVELTNRITIANGIFGFMLGGNGAFTGGTNTTAVRAKDALGSTLAMIAPMGIGLVGFGAWLAGVIVLFNQHGKRFRRRPAPVSPEQSAGA